MGDHRLIGWKYAYAVQVGEAHVACGLPCQDHAAVQIMEAGGRKFFLAAVSDGAGSATDAQFGAELVCCTLMACAQTHVAHGADLRALTRQVAQDWMARVVDQVAIQAQARARQPRDLAATALLVVADADTACCIQVGDGLIVVACGDGQPAYEVAVLPQRGEYANTTVFACDQDAIEACALRTFNGQIRDIAVMSDGMQNLALHNVSQQAHAPFFDALFPILAASAGGTGAQLNAALHTFLASPAVASRSDDDRSLVIATLR
jgi:hypothetical protein